MPYHNSLLSFCFRLLLFCVSAIAFLGCSDDGSILSSGTSTSSQASFLSAFYQSEELVYSFEYDGGRRLSRQIVRFPEGNFVSKFEYNQTGKVSRMLGVRNGSTLELNLLVSIAS
jgi:hypothetical protein